jgi:hypothetical protein
MTNSVSRWPLWGALLLIIPTIFVVSSLAGHTPNWGVLQNPIVILGSIAVAGLGSLLSLVHVEVVRGKPQVLRIDIEVNVRSIMVLAVASSLAMILVGYAFVENFSRR